MQLTILIGIALAIVAVAFALQNNVPVTVTFLMWRFDSTLAMVLLLAVAFGALIVAMLSTPSVLRLQWQGTRQRKQIAALEQSRDELQEQLRRLGTGAAQAGTETESALAKMAPRRP